jgi:hypothetical protein
MIRGLGDAAKKLGIEVENKSHSKLQSIVETIKS